MTIEAFTGRYRFLSNFYPSVIVWEGIVYATVEHAYQALKTDDIESRRAIAGMTTPGHAKRLGQNVVLRDNWEKDKVFRMLELLYLKFESPALRKKLLGTRDEQLVEGNNWGDTFWGVCNGKGKNILGKLLMQIRHEIRMGEA